MGIFSGKRIQEPLFPPQWFGGFNKETGDFCCHRVLPLLSPMSPVKTPKIRTNIWRPTPGDRSWHSVRVAARVGPTYPVARRVTGIHGSVAHRIGNRREIAGGVVSVRGGVTKGVGLAQHSPGRVVRVFGGMAVGVGDGATWPYWLQVKEMVAVGFGKARQKRSWTIKSARWCQTTLMANFSSYSP